MSPEGGRETKTVLLIGEKAGEAAGVSVKSHCVGAACGPGIRQGPESSKAVPCEGKVSHTCLLRRLNNNLNHPYLDREAR